MADANGQVAHSPGGVVLLIFQTVNLSGDGINQPVKKLEWKRAVRCKCKERTGWGRDVCSCFGVQVVKIDQNHRSRAFQTPCGWCDTVGWSDTTKHPRLLCWPSDLCWLMFGGVVCSQQLLLSCMQASTRKYRAVEVYGVKCIVLYEWMPVCARAGLCNGINGV